MIKVFTWEPIKSLAVPIMVDQFMKEKEVISFTSTFSPVRYEYLMNVTVEIRILKQ